MQDVTSIWTEKYRPRKFSDFKGQKNILTKVEAFVKKKNMPHLLFSGPAGVGKTTLSLIIAREMFGEEWRSNFLELNASDERGIDVIRNKVKDFAKTKSLSEVPFKIIYLDECDALTRDAQQALRRTMENYTKSTRFILSCNFSSKIIEPIQSRCSIFRFAHLEEKEIYSLIDHIVKGEDLRIDDEAKKLLFEISDGDCRKLENLLQSAASMTQIIKQETILELVSFAKPREIEDMLVFALKNNFPKSKELLHKILMEQGISGLDLIKQIQQQVSSLELKPLLKLRIIERCGEIEYRLVEGSDEYIQLEALLAAIALYSYKFNSKNINTIS